MQKVFEMFVIGFSGAIAMPKWILFSGITSFSVMKAGWNYSQEEENTSAGYKDQDIIRKMRHRLWNFGGESIIVWCAIKPDGTRILIRCPNRMNYIVYEEVLKKELLPGWLPCYKSKVVSSFWTRQWSACLVIGRLSHRIWI